MILKLLLTLLLTTSLFARYSNCEFQNNDYSDICQSVVAKGVTYKYANIFLLSYFKTKKFDEISWKYLQPNKLKYHRQKEKQANNVLLSYVPKMVKNLKKFSKVYDYAEKTYGVNREIIAAILLKETKLGIIKPSHDAFIVFNTILTRVSSNTSRELWLKKMSKTNMVSIINYCYKKKLSPNACELASSYAGAVGIAQFMPNSFIYAKAYKNKIADLTHMEDAIVSVANFLHQKAKFNTLIHWNKIKNMAEVENAWYLYEFENEHASFVYETGKNGKVYACFTKDKKELEYMKKYVKKIMRYNNSSNYALGVLRLAYEANINLR